MPGHHRRHGTHHGKPYQQTPARLSASRANIRNAV